MPRVILSPSGNAPVVSSAKISFGMEWFVVRGRLVVGKGREGCGEARLVPGSQSENTSMTLLLPAGYILKAYSHEILR